MEKSKWTNRAKEEEEQQCFAHQFGGHLGLVCVEGVSPSLEAGLRGLERLDFTPNHLAQLLLLPVDLVKNRRLQRDEDGLFLWMTGNKFSFLVFIRISTSSLGDSELFTSKLG